MGEQPALLAHPSLLRTNGVVTHRAPQLLAQREAAQREEHRCGEIGVIRHGIEGFADQPPQVLVGALGHRAHRTSHVGARVRVVIHVQEDL